MRIHKREYNHTLLAAEDRVFASAPISMEGGKFLSAWGEVQVVASADVDVKIAVMIMARGVVAMNSDMSTTTRDLDELWDALVPKDTAHDNAADNRQIDLEIEEGEEVLATFSEPGLPNMTVLAEGDGIWAERVWDYSEIMTFAKTSDGFKDATPDTYIPNTVFPMMAEKNVMMTDLPGYVLFAFGTPLLTSTTATVRPVFGQDRWLMLRHLTKLIDDAWMHFAGLTEATAEDPFLDIASMMVELTEPNVQEETAGAWGTASFNCWSETNIITEVPASDVVPSTLSAV